MRLLNYFLAALIFASATAHADNSFGSITGDIRLEGYKLKSSAPAIIEYQGPCGTKRPTSVVKLWKNRVMDVTLWLTPQDENAPAPEGEPAAVNMVEWQCDFRPKMIVARPLTTVKIANEDPSTQWLLIEEDGKAKLQVMQEPAAPPVEIVIQENTNVHLLSGFYPWMEAWIKPVPDLIMQTTTAWDGRFFFKDVAPGGYILHVWHPSLGGTIQWVTVEPDKKADVEIIYPKIEDKIPVIEASSLEEFSGSDELDENPFK